MRLTTLLFAAAVVAAPLAVTPSAAPAQGMFDTRLQVNDRIITNYEVTQRARFLDVLNTSGDLEALALEALIEDRLRLDAAAAYGVTATEEQVRAGMNEFAGRAGMDADQFIAALASDGIDAATFRDFVEAGLLWREVVRQRFGNRIGQITEADIDLALSASSQQRALRILLSEIVLPGTPEWIDQTGPLADELSASIRSEAEFAEAAQQYSASQSREAGGRIDWLPLANLPPAIADMFRNMSPGQVTEPLYLGNAIVIFQLRALAEEPAPPPSAVTVEYAQFLIPGTGPEAQAEAARINASIDTCVDLNRIAAGLPQDQLTFTTQSMPEVPQDIGLELARLDANESSARLTRGNATVFLMLCSRRAFAGEAPTRAQAREQVVNQRLNGFSDILLDELRANAFIR
ncbi:peptidylprolyl isomerase [Halodurantibacterium flavum]|uniref:Parvulin-like PPIase n=2 Tax=Halodurantibacterium flavum TaxID=1382802 RepID=A0ABW4S425_9RHOB